MTPLHRHQPSDSRHRISLGQKQDRTRSSCKTGCHSCTPKQRVEFSTIHQAVNGDVVLEEQIHGLALPGRPLAPIKNVAVYRVVDGLITEWRDYTNPQFAQTLL